MFDGYNGGPLMNPLARIQQDDACLTCNGRGGTPYRHDPIGDGVGFEYLFEICPDCYGVDICPGCGALYMGLRSLPIGDFECSVCGWMYDPDR